MLTGTTRQLKQGPGFVLASLLMALFLLAAVQPANAVAVRPGFNANTLARNDDGSTGLQAIGFAVNFFGVTFNQLAAPAKFEAE